MTSITLCSTKSPGLNLLNSTLWSWYFVNFCLYFVFICKASYLTLSRKSRFNLRLFLLASSLKGSLLRLDRLTSIGITASEPKTNLKGVSPVWALTVVRYAHNTPGSSFGHAPFTLMIFSNVQFVTSVCPLACGCLGGEMILDS